MAHLACFCAWAMSFMLAEVPWLPVGNAGAAAGVGIGTVTGAGAGAGGVKT